MTCDVKHPWGMCNYQRSQRQRAQAKAAPGRSTTSQLRRVLAQLVRRKR